MRLNVKGTANILIVIIFLISSFDIFLNVRVGGFSLRVIFVFIILLALLYLVLQIKGKFSSKLKFLSGNPFFIWTGFLIIFIPHTTILSRNIGYVVWLLLLTTFIVILPYFVNTISKFYWTLKWYIYSFVFISIFGLLQFFLGMKGISLFVTQYWDSVKVPRINGFSYEPSYFSTYMLIAWVFCFYLMMNRNSLNKYLHIKPAFFLSTIVLILSTSRMGILIMIGIIAVYVFKSLKQALITFKINKQALMILIPFLSLGLFGFIFAVFNFEKILFLFNGLGLFGTAAHSTQTRLREFHDTLTAFWNSPFIGYSLGGIPSAIAEVRGITITTQVEAKSVEGMNIFAEVLAASGIVGFLFFAFFLTTFFYHTYSLANKLFKIDKMLGIVIMGLLFSLFIELLILNMNQNILRPYLWVHFAMVNLSYFIGKEVFRNATFKNNALEKIVY